ncbi:MAG: ECF-type sigma factor [Verrucomicrobiota bacterium]
MLAFDYDELRHGGGYERVELVENQIITPDTDEQLIAIDEALKKLAKEYPMQSPVVKLRYFAGIANEETAQLLDLSVSTVNNYWVFARVWPFSEMKKR